MSTFSGPIHRFEIRLEDGKGSAQLKAVLAEARYGGLVHCKEAGSVAVLRLHSLLAPRFQIPHRKPLYDLKLTTNQAIELTKRKLKQSQLEQLLIAMGPPAQLGLLTE